MASRHEQQNANVTGADTVILPANERRIRIIIGCPRIATVWVNFSGKAVVGVGLPLHPGTNPLTIDSCEGDFPFIEDIRAISDGVAENIGVVQVLR